MMNGSLRTKKESGETPGFDYKDDIQSKIRAVFSPLGDSRAPGRYQHGEFPNRESSRPHERFHLLVAGYRDTVWGILDFYNEA